MKKSIILFTGIAISLSILFTACQKQEISPLNGSNDTTFNYFDVPIIDGILHFNNVEQFIEKRAEMEQLTAEERIQTANSSKFNSLELLHHNVLEALSLTDDDNRAKVILSSNIDILDEQMNPLIFNTTVAPVVNRLGLVVIGSDVYRYGATEDHIFADAADKLEGNEFEATKPFVFNHPEESTERGVCHPTYNTALKEGSCKRRVMMFARAIREQYKLNSWEWEVRAKIKFEGLPNKKRKRCGGSWKVYKTNNYLNISSCWWQTANGQKNGNESYYDYNNWYGINWTPTLHVQRGISYNQIQDWYPIINYLDGNYWSGGVGSPGAEIDCI